MARACSFAKLNRASKFSVRHRNRCKVCGRARGYYRKAFDALPAADRRAQRPGLIMAAIYRSLLEEIEREGFRVLTQRTSLTPLRKFWIAWKTWLAA